MPLAVGFTQIPHYITLHPGKFKLDYIIQMQDNPYFLSVFTLGSTALTVFPPPEFILNLSQQVPVTEASQ